MTWDRWFQGHSLFALSQLDSIWLEATIAYVVSTFVYYWWHRLRHESQFFWRLCHELTMHGLHGFGRVLLPLEHPNATLARPLAPTPRIPPAPRSC